MLNPQKGETSEAIAISLRLSQQFLYKDLSLVETI